jgi:hypothetical protein
MLQALVEQLKVMSRPADLLMKRVVVRTEVQPGTKFMDDGREWVVAESPREQEWVDLRRDGRTGREWVGESGLICVRYHLAGIPTPPSEEWHYSTLEEVELWASRPAAQQRVSCAHCGQLDFVQPLLRHLQSKPCITFTCAQVLAQFSIQVSNGQCADELQLALPHPPTVAGNDLLGAVCYRAYGSHGNTKFAEAVLSDLEAKGTIKGARMVGLGPNGGHPNQYTKARTGLGGGGVKCPRYLPSSVPTKLRKRNERKERKEKKGATTEEGRHTPCMTFLVTVHDAEGAEGAEKELSGGEAGAGSFDGENVATKQVSLALQGEKLIVTGDTYPLRVEMRAAGGEWNKRQSAWVFSDVAEGCEEFGCTLLTPSRPTATARFVVGTQPAEKKRKQPALAKSPASLTKKTKTEGNSAKAEGNSAKTFASERADRADLLGREVLKSFLGAGKFRGQVSRWCSEEDKFEVAWSDDTTTLETEKTVRKCCVERVSAPTNTPSKAKGKRHRTTVARSDGASSSSPSPSTFAELWPHLLSQGWIVQEGRGLDNWHYLPPRAQQMKVSERKRGVDYFVSEEDVLSHAN